MKTKCMSCGNPMKSARENYKYEASGLPYVTLRNVEVRRCANCGEFEVVIPNIEELHRAIALVLIAKPARLTAEEIRFLRTYLGWTGADFGRHMGVTPESVSRWENGREQMGAVADRLVRLLVANRKPMTEYPMDKLVDLSDKPVPLRAVAETKKGAWTVTEKAA